MGWPSLRSAALGTPEAVGAAVLLAIALACFGSLPWTMASVDVGSGATARRFEASNLRLSLLPPSWLAPKDVTDQVEAARAAGQFVPSMLLGTDRLGRDLLARCLAGGAISLTVGICAALLTVALGTAYGLASGYAGGRIDSVMMRTVDILYGLPSLLLVVLLALGVEGGIERIGWKPGETARRVLELVVLFLALGGVGWLTMARVIRGQVLSLRAQPFMEACRALGVSPLAQCTRHLLPNLIAPIIVYAALAVPAAILMESFLAFLGIGVREPLPSWGNLAADGLGEVNLVASRWWILLWPCVLVALTLLALNFLGDGLRQRWDPMRTRAGAREAIC